MGTDRKLTLPKDLAVPAGKGSFKQPIYFPMKAFSRQALGRARLGLYRRGAALTFRVSGGEFQGTYRSHRKPEQYYNLSAVNPAFISKPRISLPFSSLLKNYKAVNFFFLKGRLEGQWHPTPVLLTGTSHGRRSLVAVHGVAKSGTQLSDFTFTFHFHALEKEMATHSSVLAWRTPGTGEPGGLPSKGSHTT